METKLKMVGTKAFCTHKVQKLDRIEECGWRPINVVEGTSEVKCLDCKGTVKVPEFANK